MYRAIKRGYAVVAIGTHLSQAAFNFHCFNTTWPPEDHIEGPEVCMHCCHTPHTVLHDCCSNTPLYDTVCTQYKTDGAQHMNTHISNTLQGTFPDIARAERRVTEKVTCARSW